MSKAKYQDSPSAPQRVPRTKKRASAVLRHIVEPEQSCDLQQMRRESLARTLFVRQMCLKRCFTLQLVFRRLCSHIPEPPHSCDLIRSARILLHGAIVSENVLEKVFLPCTGSFGGCARTFFSGSLNLFAVVQSQRSACTPSILHIPAIVWVILLQLQLRTQHIGQPPGPSSASPNPHKLSAGCRRDKWPRDEIEDQGGFV